MDLAGANRDQLLGEVINLITGTSFMMFGLVALVIACIRRRATGVRAIFLLGIWAIIYGSQAFNYNSILLTLVAGLLTFRELTLGFVRKLLGAMAIIAIVIAVLGFGKFVLTHQEDWLLTYNEILATLSLIFWLPFLASSKFAHKYIIWCDRGVLLVG